MSATPKLDACACGSVADTHVQSQCECTVPASIVESGSSEQPLPVRRRLRSKTASASLPAQHKDIRQLAALQASVSPPPHIEGALVQDSDLCRGGWQMCFPQTGESDPCQRLPRVAMALCSKACPAPRLREWLFWHLSLGVSIIFLRWEGELNAEQLEVLRGPQSRGEVVLKRECCDLSCAFNSVMTRQVRFVQTTMRLARKRNYDFLLHLDDDELLCPLRPDISLTHLFKRHLGSQKRCIHFENYEAMFEFEQSTLRPFSRSSTRFKTGQQVLYCNGKSAANLALQPIFASGVHHFCKYDRCFEPEDPAYGLHDNAGGCTHEDCCQVDHRAVVLHFDSPSFSEWRAKFMARASSKLEEADNEEMDCFAFKKQSIRILRKRPAASRSSEEKVYRNFRCLPGDDMLKWSSRLSGEEVEKRFRVQLDRHRTAQQEQGSSSSGA